MRTHLSMQDKLLRNRDFLLLTQGQLVNQAGSQIALAATAFLLKQTTNSASLIGFMTALSALPLLLLSPLGGAVADRYSRRNLLILCDLLCAVVSCTLAFLVRSHLPDIAVLAVGLLAGNLLLASAIAFSSPALNALIPSVVRTAQIGGAMAFAQASGLIALIMGQVVGGLLLTHYSPATLYWIDAGTYLFSAGAESLVQGDPSHAAEVKSARKPRLLDDIREGFEYVWQRRGMRALLLAAIPLNVLTTPVIMLLPFYITNSLAQPLARYGYLLAVLSLGMLTGYASAGSFPPSSKHRHSVLFGCVLGCAATILALASTRTLSQALVALFLLGLLIGAVTLVSLSVLIQQTEEPNRGRVGAVLLMVTQGLTPLAMSLIGVVADLLGKNIRLLYSGCGVGLLVTVMVMVTNRDLREFLRSSAP